MRLAFKNREDELLFEIAEIKKTYSMLLQEKEGKLSTLLESERAK